MAVNYDELAKKYGGTVVPTPPGGTGGGKDLGALAAKFGGSVSDAAVNDVKKKIEEPETVTGHPIEKFLAKSGEFFRSAALAPVEAATGALKVGQELAQEKARELGLTVPEKGAGVLTDVLVHGGELGMDLLKKQQETSSAAQKGAVAGDIGLTVASTADVGKKAGAQAFEAIKKGKVLPAVGKGFISGVEGGAAGGAVTALESGKGAKDVAEEAAIGGAIGGPVGGVLSGLAALGVKGGGTVKNLMTRHRLSTDRKALEAAQADELLFGTGKTVNPNSISPEGIAPLRPSERAALEISRTADVNPGDAGLFREAKPEERNVMKKMFSLAEKNLGKRAPDELTVQEPGKYILGNIQKLDDLRDSAGQRLEDAIQAMPEEPLDVSGAKTLLDDFLSKNGVKVATTDDVLTDIADSAIDGGSARKIKGSLDFGGSKRFKDSADVQKHLASIYDDLKDGVLTPEEIIGTRRRLFDILDLGKDKKDIVAPIEGMLGKVRELLDEPLSALSDDYAVAAQDYAISRKALSDWYRKLGMDFIEGQRPSASLKAGEIGRRFLGNASADYRELFDATDDALAHFGIKAKVDPRTLLRWSAALEDLFGTTQSQSLRGQVGGGVSDALNPVVDVATGGKTAVLRKGAELIDKATGKTKEAQREAMKKIIEAFLSD